MCVTPLFWFINLKTRTLARTWKTITCGGPRKTSQKKPDVSAEEGIHAVPRAETRNPLREEPEVIADEVLQVAPQVRRQDGAEARRQDTPRVEIQEPPQEGSQVTIVEEEPQHAPVARTQDDRTSVEVLVNALGEELREAPGEGIRPGDPPIVGMKDNVKPKGANDTIGTPVLWWFFIVVYKLLKRCF